MKISIVTAVYNREATIEDALNSVHQQTYRDVQHIIQDGSSTDATLDIIRSHKNDRIDLASGRDSGIYDAINRGMQRAQGDVVGLMHSDDIFAHETVLAQIAHAFEDPQVDCVYGDLQYVASNDTNRVIRHWKSGDYSREILARGWMPPHPTFYIRRAILERLGDYDTSYQIAADYDAMLRWLWTGSIQPTYIPDVLVKMRVGGESNRSLSRIVQKSREDLRALKSNGVDGVQALFLKNISKIKQFRTLK